MDWDLHVLPGYLGEETEYGQAEGSRDSLSCGPSLQLQTYICISISISSDSDESPPVMYSPDSESVINSSAVPSEWSSFLARLLWKGQSLWLERRCVLDPHVAHFPFPWCFPLPRPLPFPLPLFWFTPSSESHTISSTSLSPLSSKYVSRPYFFDHLIPFSASTTSFYFSSTLRFFLGVVLANSNSLFLRVLCFSSASTMPSKTGSFMHRYSSGSQ